MIAPAKLLTPNFCVGNRPVQKISYNNSVTEYENYFPVYPPFYQGNFNTLSIIVAFGKYYIFQDSLTGGSNYCRSESILEPKWTRHWFKPSNVPLAAEEVVLGGGFYYGTNNASGITKCFAQNKLLMVGQFFWRLDPTLTWYNTKPNYYLYTTDGLNWLTGGPLPMNSSWQNIIYFKK